MMPLIEKLEAIGERLRRADPGDAESMAPLLADRASVLAELAEVCSSSAEPPEAEWIARLEQLSGGMADVYRGIALERLLTLQNFAALEREKSVLKSLSQTLEHHEPGKLLNQIG